MFGLNQLLRMMNDSLLRSAALPQNAQNVRPMMVPRRAI